MQNLSKSELKFFNNWIERRKKGKGNFILTEGLGFSIFMIIFMGVSSYFLLDEGKTWKYFLFQSLLCLPFGFLYSTIIWFIYERKIKDYQSKK